MSKTGAVIRLIVWSIVAILLAGMFFFFFTGSKRDNPWSYFKEYFQKGERHEVFSQVSAGNAIKQVDIEWYSGDVTVQPSSDNQVHVTQTSNYDVEQLQYDDTNGHLTIRQERWNGFAFLGFWKRSSDVTVLLPQKQYEKFMLKMTSGDSKVSEIAAEECDVFMTSGFLVTDGVTTQKADLHVTSGKMQMSDFDAGELTYEMTSGTLLVDGRIRSISGETTSGTVKLDTSVQPEKMDVSLTSGKVSVRIPGADGFKLKCKKISGSFDSDFEMMSTKDGNESMYVYQSGGTNDRRYTVNMTSGSFKLNKSMSGTTGNL